MLDLEFIESLSTREQDLLNGALNDLVQDGAPESLARLNADLAQTKKRIDRVNHRRNHLGAQISQMDTIIDVLRKLPTGNLAVTILLDALLARRNDLRSEIEQLKPAEDLSKKHKIKRMKEKLEMRRRVGQAVINKLTAKRTASQRVATEADVA